MFRDSFGFNEGHRARRGDMAPIILNALLEKPMHGYEIISHLEAKTHGMWRPSAGSVYPNLQLLEEQDLITSKNENDKKIYSLTDKGKVEAERVHDRFKARWEERDSHAKSHKDLKMSFVDAMGILKQIASQDSEAKNEKVKEILNEAKDKLAKLRDEDIA
jgi:DNA-binding PadR family transcriptional regulator